MRHSDDPPPLYDSYANLVICALFEAAKHQLMYMYDDAAAKSLTDLCNTERPPAVEKRQYCSCSTSGPKTLKYLSFARLRLHNNGGNPAKT